jgi:hypothetical protein
VTTLAIMKARIADELARSDLTSQIAYAIGDAIDAYKDERFHFNESRAITFVTSADQEFYDSTDAAALATINKIDYVTLYLGDQPFQLEALTPAQIEHSSTNGTSTGQSSWYCWYGEQIRLYPVPSGAWTVRIGAAVNAAAPADDDEASNPWMTHAERLIRSRAKMELALHVLKDIDLAQTMGQAVEEAFQQLKEKSNRLTQVGEGRIRPFC